jgi:copper resistance protein B
MRTALPLLLGAAALTATPVAAQTHHMHGAMTMDAEQSHDHQVMTASPPPAPPADAAGQDHGAHAGHDMPAGRTDAASAPSGTDLPPGDAPAPAVVHDRSADRYYGADAMAGAEARMMATHGGMTYRQIMFNLAEYQARKGQNGYRWVGEGWFGGDIDRFVVKTEGEGTFREGVDSAEVQALYSRALDPYWNLQLGLRHDFAPGPDRSYAALGVKGLAPYWFETEAALFLSDKGDLIARIEGYYDQRLTRRLVLQPRAELNFAAQDVPGNRIGAGLSDAELGLRLRYEIRREFAPYVGLSWERRIGHAARFARAAGESARATGFVAGVRFWF